MPDLIAQGPQPENHWRRRLPAGPVTLGRDGWGAAWEPFLSRRHAELEWSAGRLHVRPSAARNPVFRDGDPVDGPFELGLGAAFVVGRTTFTVVPDAPSSSAPGARHESLTVAHGDLAHLPFRDAPHRLDVLSKLPDVIAGAASDPELFAGVCEMLLAGLPRADAVALVATEVGAVELFGPAGSVPEVPVRVLHTDRRRAADGPFVPSRRLVVEAVAAREATVLHVWRGPARAHEPAGEFTVQGGFDWSFCTPVGGEACRGWGLVAAGRFTTDDAPALSFPARATDLRDDVKFAELVADILSSLRQVQVLRERQGVFRRFFSPGVLHVVAGRDAARALEPREVDATVLFCDLRGFSRTVEEASGQLLDVLTRVSAALGVMTRAIVENRGAIADFLGDAAMGFWGWPLDDPAKVENACRAGLAIRDGFAAVSSDRSHPLFGFRAGIGIATGRAVAGGIGTAEQAKVGVFGPVVNLASRLEGMTKPLRVPILLDEATAAAVRAHLPADVARVRRLARVKPAGLETPLDVSELLPPAGPDAVLTDVHLTEYAAALEAFMSGDWSAADDRLHRLPPRDRGKDLLTGFILQHNHAPPPGWDGVVPLAAK
ncbi:adenylate/guanylate cyclase domain-containing protein [Urbifossiella limnaea]|uniref:Adenylate cyclase 1 n=1 Tax=Urbifossiella limnaea TaxID=2528023 RepID=A0A517Y2T5_9BACT|nr:adenylate/guanylate cyclase domain-containing protein [Urbifossiella limnaea]QDU24100.1 Adenylate cyclase 1 [Urbifossiella limnaea]